MLVDKTMTDLTGQTCDRIGVGYTAFKFATERCRKPAGSCLGNQPDDLYKADKKLLEENRAPDYLLQRWGKPFIPPTDYGQRFSFIDPQRRASVITLELEADHVQWVVYLYANVCLMHRGANA